ncbi:hypothetical protein [Brevundimonas sp. A19_0]|uniref:hypothetical protein n=1 Tax=Brevundimonas sp. A19_0 TaxID=2821087 RepID=UPI001AD9CB50|nr:hypothetical protein [Brevundimonas sp. A19_0]MBO9501115.1 hypothetical protein [Brevundimonas sp. A19_0]
MSDETTEKTDVFITGSAVRVRPVAKGQGCLISAALLGGAFVAFFVVIFLVMAAMGMVTSDDDRQSIRGILLLIAGVALIVWGAGWVFRWNTRRGLREQVEARLPGFTGRTIPVGQLLNGPAAAGKLEGNYLMAVGQDRFLLMRHFHNTEHLDAFRALVLGQFINAWQPNGLARVMDFAIPYGNIRSVSVDALTPEQLRKGAFGRAVAHGLASWALDAAFGTRSTQDIKAAFIRIEMIDGQSLVFSVPSRVSERLVFALAASAENASHGTGHEVSLGNATWDGIETLLSRSGLVDAPSDGWDDFFANLRPDGQRARSFAGLAAWRIQQEMDRAAGRTRPVPPEATPASPGPSIASRPRNRTTLALWALGLLGLATLFIALSEALRDGGNGDLELGVIAIFSGIALVVGINLWAARSGWLMAGIKSVLSLILAAFVAFALGSELLLTRGPLAPMTQSMASATASLFGRDHRPRATPQQPVRPETPTEEEAAAARAALEARLQQEAAAAAQARQEAEARERAERIAAAEAIIRRVYDDELSLFGSRTERSAWLTPALSRRIDQVNEAASAYGGAGAVVGFDPLIDGQDANLANFDYASRETDYGVEVRVRFTNFETPVDLTFELVETDAGWRVRQIRSRGESQWTATGLLDQAETDARDFE